MISSGAQLDDQLGRPARRPVRQADLPAFALVAAAWAQPGSALPATCSPLPRAASAASLASAMPCACRWVAAWPSIAVRKDSLASLYTVASVRAVTLAVRGT